MQSSLKLWIQSFMLCMEMFPRCVQGAVVSGLQLFHVIIEIVTSVQRLEDGPRVLRNFHSCPLPPETSFHAPGARLIADLALI